MRDEFEKASVRRDYGFEEEVLDYLQSFIKDNEKKIEIAKRRIENVEDNPELEKLVHSSVVTHYSTCTERACITTAQHSIQ